MAARIQNISDRVIIPATCNEHFLPLAASACASLRRYGVEAAGLSDLRAPYCMARTAPRYHVVLFTLSGRATWRSGVASGSLHAGDVWFGPANCAYEYRASPRWHVAWFHLQQRARKTFGGFVTRRSELGRQIQDCMRGLLFESRGRIGEAYADLLGLLLDRELSAGVVQEAYATPFASLWQSVGESLHHPWRSAEMAKRVHLSNVQFFRVNKRLYGVAPLALLNQRRMQRGAEMLGQTDYKIEQIAGLLGFSTAFSFSKAFKRYWKVSPGKFRKALPK